MIQPQWQFPRNEHISVSFPEMVERENDFRQQIDVRRQQMDAQLRLMDASNLG